MIHSLTILKKYFTPVFIFLFFLAADVHAQSINGDTIYVNSKIEVAVRFPAMPSSFYTNPVDAPYNIKTLGNGFTITAKTKNSLPASLTVTEGKRTHLFFLQYKKNIDFRNTRETDLDYSTTQKLGDHVKQVAASRDLEKKYAAFKASSNNNIEQKKYKEAQDDCSQMLNLKPDDAYAKKQLKKITNLLDAEKKGGKSKNKSGKNPEDRQASDELNAKYPQIDFSTYPPEQQFNKSAFDKAKNTSAITEILAEKPRLDIDDKSQKIKLVCQGFDFKGNTVFMKLQVQNNSKDVFLTGAMLLTWKKKSVNAVNLYPMSIYPDRFPVLKPGEAATLIYTFKPDNIADGDHLNFTLTDRLNKIKLELEIKGSVYTQEFIRH